MVSLRRLFGHFHDPERDAEADADLTVPALRINQTIHNLLERGMTQHGGMAAEQLPDGRYEVTFILAPRGWRWRPPGETE